MHKKSKVITIIIITVLSIGAILMLFPFVWMIASSFKTNADAIAMPPQIFGSAWTLENYRTLFVDLHRKVVA